MILILIGLRGSGKSTVGRIIAQMRGFDFVDLDDLTPGFLGEKTVADAWRKHGEAAFRNAESAALFRLLSECVNKVVIAAGGGTPTAPGAAENLRKESAAKRAMVVYLATSEAALRDRLIAADNANRPSLTGADPLEEIGQVLKQRDALYRSLAAFVVYTDGKTTQEVANEVLTEIPCD